MAKNRPTSRKKRVGTGSAKVSKRGSGLGSRVSKPVGSSSRSRKPTSFSSMRPPSNGSSSSNYRRGGSSAKSKLIMIIVVIVALFLIYNFLKGGGMSENDFGSSQTVSNPNDVSSSSNVANSSSTVDEYNVNRLVSEMAEDKRTTLLGNGNDTATVMIYVLGTDLESKSGMATGDIMEMTRATIADNVNVIIETGGTKTWKNDIISNKTNQRYQVASDGLLLLEEDLGKKSMVDPDTLSDFIKYCKSNFPANRYELILWDHGGGSLTGFGYDEYFPNDHMTLDEVQEALEDGNTLFDFIGFDACLMGTLETAIVLAPYADYMIASEETEPGIGWYYTDWLSVLSMDTSIATIDLGKQIIDDYIYHVTDKTPRSQGTLSLIDLGELRGTIPRALQDFAVNANELIGQEDYQKISDARAGTKEFSKAHQLNQIDLIDFALKMDTEESLVLAETLQSIVKYNRTTRNISNANGVSIYFPYNSLSKLSSMIDTYEEIGMNDEYSDVIKSFASVAAGGQVVSSGSGNLLGSLLGGSTSEQQPSNSSGMVGNLLSSFLSGGDFSSITGGIAGAASNWFKPEVAEQSTEYYEENLLNTEELVLSGKNGQRVLELSEKQWDLIQSLELNVFIDDGEGFIDLGLDNVFDYNSDGDLIMEYDQTWLTLNGNIVSYYMVADESDDDNYYVKGRVPAFLNGQLVDIIIVFDDVNPYGSVVGAQVNYGDNGESDALGKGLLDIYQGDVIDFICDYYTYDGEYNDSYYLGNQYVATGNWSVENLSIAEYDYRMTYRITDIYNNQYWTPSISE